ncbi:MAG: type VI secretion system protein TssA [Verrucomicrobia bacterium]|nr:type VI secretion system protein TssA [Verrucomicrobiota bacterium]
MSALVEKLLQPVSAEQPCGPDLSYDPRFDELETLLKGQPEVEIGSVVKPAEPPEWRQLRDASLDLLGASKHLRGAVMLCCGLLQVDGLPGFRDGLQFIRGLLEQYWGPVYPLLDPEDNNDPQQRLNILGALTMERLGRAGGWLQIIDYLHHAPLCRPKGLPPLSLDDVLNAKKRESGGEGAPATGPDTSAVNRAFQNAKPDDLKANHQAAVEALEALGGIDAFLTSTLGAGVTISFEELRGVLQQIERILQAKIAETPGAEAAAGTPDAASAGGEPATAGGGAPGFAGIPITGSIRSRDDVIRTLDSICEYYHQVEPVSPVPLLLRRAQKLVKMNFIQTMQELALATPDALKPAMGTAVDDALASSASSETPQ